MVNKRFVLCVAALVLALIALPLASGCAKKVAPPLEEKMVAYLSISDYTGPAAGLSAPGDEGVSDYFKHINDTGGINGVKVKFIGVDARYDTARGVSAYKRYRTEPRLMLINFVSSATALGATPMVERDRLVGLNPHEGSSVVRQGRLFTWGPTFQDSFGFAIDWMVKDWKAKGNSGMPTVGYLHWDNPYGHSFLQGGKEYAEKVGVKLLPPEFCPPGTVDYFVWLNRIAVSSPSYVFIGGTDPNISLLLRDAHNLGMTKTVQFVCDYYGPTDTVGGKLHPEAIENACIVSFVVRDNEAREHPLLKELWTTYREKPLSEMIYIYGEGVASLGMTFVGAVKAALKEVGYNKLDGDAMYRAMKTGITGLDKQGLMGPCTYTETERRQSKVGKMYRIVKGTAVPITDWTEFPDTVSLYKW